MSLEFLFHTDIVSRLMRILSKLNSSEGPIPPTQEWNELDHFEGISSIRSQLVHNVKLPFVFLSSSINLQVHRMLLHYNWRNGDTKSSLGKLIESDEAFHFIALPVEPQRTSFIPQSQCL